MSGPLGLTWECPAYDTPEEVVPSEHRSSILRVGIRLERSSTIILSENVQNEVHREGTHEIIEHALKKKKSPDAEERRGNDRYDPVDAGSCRPSEKELQRSQRQSKVLQEYAKRAYTHHTDGNEE